MAVPTWVSGLSAEQFQNPLSLTQEGAISVADMEAVPAIEIDAMWDYPREIRRAKTGSP